MSDIGDDMLDLPEELLGHEAVRDAIGACNSTLIPLYNEADSRSLRHQKWHRRLAIVAAVLGTLAVLLAILQLTHLLPGPLPAGLEASAVVVATLAVTLGLILSFQSQWQVERNKAERCRLLKFRFLTNPEYWCADAAGQSKCQEQLKNDVKL